MSTEVLARNPEVQPEGPEQLFEDARATFFDLLRDPALKAECVQRGVVAGDTDNRAYWETVADFAEHASARAQQAGEVDERTAIQELVATTPAFVFHQVGLEGGRGAYESDEQYQAALDSVSRYGNLIRYIGAQYPDLRPSALAGALTDIAERSIVDHVGVQQVSANIIGNAVREVQHTLVFGQLLERAGRNFQVADGGQGVDYVVQRSEGSPLYVDVIPSSLTEAEAEKLFGGQPYSADGRLSVHSLVPDSELGDSFQLPEAIATERAGDLNRLLNQVPYTSPAPRSWAN
jgi:hypothetical protein